MSSAAGAMFNLLDNSNAQHRVQYSETDGKNYF